MTTITSWYELNVKTGVHEDHLGPGAWVSCGEPRMYGIAITPNGASAYLTNFMGSSVIHTSRLFMKKVAAAS
jgi:hypothetical protein